MGAGGLSPSEPPLTLTTGQHRLVHSTLRPYSKVPTRNSAIADKPRDAMACLTSQNTPLPTCIAIHHVKFASSASKDVCTNRREPKKLGSARAPTPCGRGVGDPQKIYTSPHVLSCRIWSFQIKRYDRTSVIKEIRLKNLTIVSRLSRSLKVIGTDTQPID